MQMRAGIPLAGDVAEMVKCGEFATHLKFHDEFRARHQQALSKYYWSRNPLKLWSRRWEYPFAAERVLAFAREMGNRQIKMLDAGSGVTYFPYFLCERIPSLSVLCSDYNASYKPVFDGINRAVPNSRVDFREGLLQKLPVGNGEMDILCCISVLEHTDDYPAAVAEFARVLRPGGLLVLTFDISLDGKFKLTEADARQVLTEVGRKFAVEEGLNAEGELKRVYERDGILTTDLVKQSEPELLPWKWPMLMGLRDLMKGKGWTGGFKSKTIFCLSGRAAQVGAAQNPIAASTA
jgi:SAM-dependent methyltransferase